MDTDSDWQKFLQATHVCLGQGDIARARVFTSQLYESIGLYHLEEQDDEATSKAYNLCLTEAFNKVC